MVLKSAQERLLNIVRSTIRKYGMIARGDGVVVAVSGGPDSVALLHLLHALRAECSFWIVAAHLDHRLRPESGKDREWVRRMAAELGIPVQTLGVEVRGLAAKDGISIEEAGRVARYAFLEQTRARFGARLIATAHHRDDEIETFFLRILRGSSLVGLRGIPPVRGNIIRPLIGATRAEVLAFLSEERIPYLTDSTNLDTETDRNFLRNRLFPVIGERFPHFGAPLGRTLQLVADEEDFLEREASQLYAEAVSSAENGLVLDIPVLLAAAPVLAARVVLASLYALSGPRVRWTRIHVDAILNLLRSGNPSARLTLPGGLFLVREYGRMYLGNRVIEPTLASWELPVFGPGTLEVPDAGVALRFRIIEDNREVPRFLDGRRTVVFDADVVPFPLTIRSPRPGDRFRPWGMEGTRRLKKVLIDLKVPVAQRHRIPLVVKGDAILWIPGIRRSREAPVRMDATTHVLEVSLVE
ncbi:MAG: tRNA lysidine(34) synthetase TilS [Desulfomonile sp.]|nr:tRNA lysidine(34) synthetase TilS [Desulfomonile sp.]